MNKKIQEKIKNAKLKPRKRIRGKGNPHWVAEKQLQSAAEFYNKERNKLSLTDKIKFDLDIL